MDPDAASHLQDIDISALVQFDDFVVLEIIDLPSLSRRLSGFFIILASLLSLALLVPPPFLEQHHIRPSWSLVRPDQTVIATQVTGVTPLNRKVRLYIRFLDGNRSKPPQLVAPIQIFASKDHRLVSELTSSFPPPIPDVGDEHNSPFHCVFESVLVNFDTCYFRALVPNVGPEFIEVKWLVIRTFFASFEFTFSLAFAGIIATVIFFRVCRQPGRRIDTWDPQQKMTMDLSIVVLAFDLFGAAPALFFPSFFTLGLGEVVRSGLRAFLVFYLLFTFNSLLRGRRTLKTVVSLPPFVLAVLLFASSAVILVSQVRKDIDFLWPIAPDAKAPIQLFIYALLAAFVTWMVILVLSLVVIVGPDHRHRPAVIAVALAPLMVCFLFCEVCVHDLRMWPETAVTFVLSNGGVNIFCLIAEFLHWPVGRIIGPEECGHKD